MKLSDAAVRQLQESIDRPDPGSRYEVRELLGRGGMGAVYRAFDHVLQRDIALKALSWDADSSSLSARLAGESQILARLEHPGIVAVHDAGVLEDGRPFYVMRLVRGVSLDVRASTLGLGDVLRLFLRVCDAVAFAHARGVIHRDLKPSNVMVGEYGEVLVLDWGVATIIGSRVVAADTEVSTQPNEWTGDGAIVGTPGFMAPEAVAAGATREIDARTDLFSLGVVLDQLLRLRGERPAPPLAAIVARATAPEPRARYATVEVLAEDVRRWLDGEPVDAYHENVMEKAWRFYSRNSTLLLLLATYAVVRVAILLWRGV
ncbi:MAG: serine/threonine-protein kinase [Gemmatimonadaceae bacterium]